MKLDFWYDEELCQHQTHGIPDLRQSEQPGINYQAVREKGADRSQRNRYNLLTVIVVKIVDVLCTRRGKLSIIQLKKKVKRKIIKSTI